MKQFSVRVRADFPYDVARVGNRPYTKTTPVTFTQEDLTDEIQSSPVLLVEEIEVVEPFDALGESDGTSAPAQKKGKKN